MEILFIVVLVSLMNMCCFTIGAMVCQKVKKGEDIEMPTINPIKAYNEREAKKEAKRAQDKLDTIMRNIERYDGSSLGQEDVPRG